jgi:transposase InsO family protein
VVNGKRVLRVMRERGLLVTPRRLRARRKKEWSRIIAERPNQIWQTDMTKVWAGPTVGWAYLVSVIDCCTRDIVGWDLSLHCRTQEAIAEVERAVLETMADRHAYDQCQRHPGRDRQSVRHGNSWPDHPQQEFADLRPAGAWSGQFLSDGHAL